MPFGITNKRLFNDLLDKNLALLLQNNYFQVKTIFGPKEQEKIVKIQYSLQNTLSMNSPIYIMTIFIGLDYPFVGPIVHLNQSGREDSIQIFD